CGIEHCVDLTAQHPHVNRSLIFGNGVHGLLNVSGVTGIDYYHVRDGTHQREVIDPLVRCAISGRQPGQSRYDLHVSPPQRNVDSDKIIGPTGSKHAVSRGKRCEPGSGEACRNSDQILLRHAKWLLILYLLQLHWHVCGQPVYFTFKNMEVGDTGLYNKTVELAYGQNSVSFSFTV